MLPNKSLLWHLQSSKNCCASFEFGSLNIFIIQSCWIWFPHREEKTQRRNLIFLFILHWRKLAPISYSSLLVFSSQWISPTPQENIFLYASQNKIKYINYHMQSISFVSSSNQNHHFSSIHHSSNSNCQGLFWNLD